MLTTPHVLVGLAIISKFPHPLGLFLSLLSHFILDFCIPHWNPHLYTELKKNKKVSSSSIKIILMDGFLGAGLTLFFMFQNLPNLSLVLFYGFSALMAVLPDLIEAPYYFFNYQPEWLKKYVYFEHKYQANANIFWGIVTQALVILACLKILL